MNVLPIAADAARLLGQMIAVRRRELGITAADLASRTGVSRTTLHKIEHGDPAVSIGNVLTAAAIVGVPIFGITDRQELNAKSRSLATALAVLPKRVHLPDVDDDF